MGRIRKFGLFERDVSLRAAFKRCPPILVLFLIPALGSIHEFSVVPTAIAFFHHHGLYPPETISPVKLDNFN